MPKSTVAIMGVIVGFAIGCSDQPDDEPDSETTIDSGVVMQPDIAGLISISNGGDIYYEQYGTHNKKTIVLFHGFTGSTIGWIAQIEALQGRFHVVVFDQRGQGRSSTACVEHDSVADAKMVFDMLNIESAHVVGLSNGGRLAAEFCQSFPSMCPLATLIAPLGVRDSVDAWVEPAAVDGSTLEMEIDGFLESAIFDRVRKNNPAEWASFEAQMRKEQTEQGDGAIILCKDFDQSTVARVETTATMSMPVQVIAPALDPIAMFATHYIDTIPDVTAVRVAKVGHVVPLEAPNKVTSAIADFEKAHRPMSTVADR